MAKRHTNPDKHRDRSPLTPKILRAIVSNDAMIDMRPGMWLEHIWAAGGPAMPKLGFPGHYAVNFMACLCRAEGGDWELRTRMSFEFNEDAFQFEDRKVRRYFAMKGTLSREQALAAAKGFMVPFMIGFKEAHQTAIGLDGGEFDAIMDKMKSNPFMQVRSVELPTDPAQ